MTRWEDIELVKNRPLVPMGMGVEFTAKCPDADVFDRARRLGFEVKQSKLGAADVYGVSEVPTPLGASFCGHIRSLQSGEVEVSLHLARRPGGKPPPSVKAVSDFVGGFPEALEKLRQAWGDDKPIEFSAVAEYLPLGKQKSPITLRKGGAVFSACKLVSEALEFETPKSFKCVRAIRLSLNAAKADTWTIQVKGSVSLPLSRDLFDLVDEQLWNDVAKVLK